MKHGVAFATLLVLATSGCATAPLTAERIGLPADDLVRLEAGGWERMAQMDRLDPHSVPIAVRDVRCRRDPASRQHFFCDYIVDYGISGTISGSVRRHDMYLGRDTNGRWDFWVIVT